MQRLEILLAVVVAIAAFVYLVLPLAIYFTQKFRSSFAVAPIDPAHFMPDAKSWFDQNQHRLETMGFEKVGFFRNTDTAPNVSTHFVMLSNRAAGDRATITMTTASVENGTSTTVYLVEFTTEFDDGSEISTNNNGQPMAFIYDDTKRIFRLPEVFDPTLLYRVHGLMIADYAAQKTKQQPPVGGEVACLRANVRAEFERQVAAGLLRRGDEPDVYQATLTGAYRMMWAHLPPFRDSQMSARRKQAAELLKRAERFAIPAI